MTTYPSLAFSLDICRYVVCRIVDIPSFIYVYLYRDLERTNISLHTIINSLDHGDGNGT